MTNLDALEEAAYNTIKKFSKLQGIKRNNSLLVLGQKFRRFEDRCIELAGDQYIQVLNPQTDRWVKVDKSTGNIVAHKRTKGEYKNIPRAKSNIHIEKTGSEKMGKAKTGGHSQNTMESCDDSCEAKPHCTSIRNLIQNEPGMVFRCPIQSRR